MESPLAGSKSRIPAVVAVVATLVGATVRLANLPYFSCWGDELATLRLSFQPVGVLLQTFGSGVTSHLYDLFMKLWIHLFGFSPLVVKLPSLIAGAATVPLIYWLGRRWLDPPAAAVAAVLAALSKPLIIYSRMARPYALLTVAALVSMVLFLRALRSGDRRLLVAVAVLDAVMLCMSLNAVYVLLVQGLVTALQVAYRPRLPWRRLLEIGAAFALTLLLSLAFYSQALGAIATTQQSASAHHYRPALLFETFKHNHPSATGVMLAALALGAWVAWRRGDAEGRALVLWAVLPSFVYLLSKTSYPVPGIARYLVPSVPAQLLLVALGLLVAARLTTRRLNRRWALGLALVAAVWSMLSLRYLWHPGAHPSLFKEQRPTAPAVRRVVDMARPGDVVTFDLETRFYWLFAFEEGIRSAGVRELVRRPDLERPGRLIVMTNDRPLAEEWWSRHFELEVIGGPRFRERLFVLRSEPIPAGPGALRTVLRDFLQGYVEAAPGDPAWSWWKKSRQQLVLGWVHQLLAQLATEPEERRMHDHLADRYARLSRETQRGVGADGDGDGDGEPRPRGQ